MGRTDGGSGDGWAATDDTITQPITAGDEPQRQPVSSRRAFVAPQQPTSLFPQGVETVSE